MQCTLAGWFNGTHLVVEVSDTVEERFRAMLRELSGKGPVFKTADLLAWCVIIAEVPPDGVLTEEHVVRGLNWFASRGAKKPVIAAG